MWIKILCLSLITSRVVAVDPMLDPLYGVQGLNRVVICRVGREQCDGALLNREWVVARPSCLEHRPASQLTVFTQRGGDRCTDFVEGLEKYVKNMALGIYANNARRVKIRLVHPSMDISLMRVDKPYNQIDQLANATNAELIFHQTGLQKWINRIFENTMDREKHPAVPTRKMTLNSSPFLLFLVSIVLPFSLFALLYVYVIFYTGSVSEPPSLSDQYDKETSDN